MGIVENHVLEYLDEFIGNNDEFFESVFKEIKDSNKNRFEKLLRYVTRVLQTNLSKNDEGLGILHLHFQDDFNEDFKILLSHFLIIYQFKTALAKEVSSNLLNERIISLKENLRTEKRKMSSYPDGA
jgi:hypothetical protein